MIDRGIMVLVGAVLAAAVLTAGAQPSFRLLDEDPAFDGLTVWISTMTPDGAGFGGFVGRSAPPGEPPLVGFVLTDAGVRLLDWSGAGPDHEVRVTALSVDGSFAAGVATSPTGSTALRWDADGAAQDLGHLNDSDFAHAIAINADGTVVVGYSGSEAFRWNEDQGMMPLGDLRTSAPGGAVSLASGVSADGGSVVGYAAASDTRISLFRWTMDGMIDLDPFGAESYQTWGSGGGVNAITGTIHVPAGSIDTRAFRWAAGEQVAPIDDLPGVQNSMGFSVSDDGSVAVGMYGLQPIGMDRGFIWMPDTGMVDLVEHVEAIVAVDLDGWELTPTAVSRGGRVVAGWAFGPGDSVGEFHQSSFIFERFSSCPADFNGDERLDFFDFAAFVAAFVAQDTAADIKHDGLFTFRDLARFIAEFNAGCP